MQWAGGGATERTRRHASSRVGFSARRSRAARAAERRTARPSSHLWRRVALRSERASTSREATGLYSAGMPSLRNLWIAPLLVAAVAAPVESSTGLRAVGEAAFLAEVEPRIAEWLTSRGHSLSDEAMGPRTSAAIDECYLRDDPRCANDVFGKNSSEDIFVYLNFNITGGLSRERSIRGTLWLLRKAGDARTFTRECTACDAATALTMVDDLIREVGPFDEIQGALKLSSKPAGASVAIDGERVGVTPLHHELAAGRHDVQVARAGYAAERLTVTIEPAKVAEEAVELRWVGDRRLQRRRIASYVALSAGVALLAGGFTLLAVNEGSSCAPSQRQCLYTRPYGIAALAGGAVFLGAGGYLWLSSARAPTPDRSAQSTRASGVTLGWGTNF
jgi:hypothetical protein